MDQQQVDVVGPQILEAPLAGRDDAFPGAVALDALDLVVPGQPALGDQHDLVADRFQRRPHHPLGMPHAVDGGIVKTGDSKFERVPDRGLALTVVDLAVI